MTAVKLEPPNPACFVCRNATIPLTLDVQKWTLERLLKTVVKGRLGFEAPTVSIDGDFIWEEGEGADSEEFMVNLPKTLNMLPCGGIQHGTIIELDDATQKLKIQVSVMHQSDWPDQPVEEREEFPFVVGEAPPKTISAAAPPAATETSTSAPEEADDDDVVLVVDTEKSAGKKRRSESDGEMHRTKKPKLAPAPEEEVIEID